MLPIDFRTAPFSDLADLFVDLGCPPEGIISFQFPQKPPDGVINLFLESFPFQDTNLNIDILVILDRLCGRGSWSEHPDQLLGVNNALKETKIRM